MILGAVVEKTQPPGVFWAGVLNVLGALGLWFAAWVIFDLGETPGSSVSQLWVIKLIGLFGGWGVLMLVDAVLVFRGMRIGYFLSMPLWALTFAAVVSGSLVLFNGSYFAFLITPAGWYILYYVLYPAVCFARFLKSDVRTYFGT